MSYLPVPAEKALPLTCERIQFSDCSEVSDQAMEPTRDVTDQAIADLVEQAVVGPEKAWQRQLVTALMPVWLDDDGDDDDNDGDGDDDDDDDDDIYIMVKCMSVCTVLLIFWENYFWHVNFFPSKLVLFFLSNIFFSFLQFFKKKNSIFF